MERLAVVTDENVQHILMAERGVLILAETNCGYCASYGQEIADLANQGKVPGVLIGKMFLDKPGSARFKKENRWLPSLEVLPFTLIYSKGQCVDKFAGSKGSYLLERIEDNFLNT